jgi:hypothetical protein
VPSVTPSAPGAQRYEYRVIGKGLDGSFVSSEPGVTDTGPATLSSTEPGKGSTFFVLLPSSALPDRFRSGHSQDDRV